MIMPCISHLSQTVDKSPLQNARHCDPHINPGSWKAETGRSFLVLEKPSEHDFQVRQG